MSKTTVAINQVEKAILLTLHNGRVRTARGIFETLGFEDVSYENFMGYMERIEAKGYILSIANGSEGWEQVGHRFYKLEGRGYPERYFKLSEIGVALAERELTRMTVLREAYVGFLTEAEMAEALEFEESMNEEEMSVA